MVWYSNGWAALGPLFGAPTRDRKDGWLVGWLVVILLSEIHDGGSHRLKERTPGFLKRWRRRWRWRSGFSTTTTHSLQGRDSESAIPRSCSFELRRLRQLRHAKWQGRKFLRWGVVVVAASDFAVIVRVYIRDMRRTDMRKAADPIATDRHWAGASSK